MSVPTICRDISDPTRMLGTTLALGAQNGSTVRMSASFACLG